MSGSIVSQSGSTRARSLSNPSYSNDVTQVLSLSVFAVPCISRSSGGGGGRTSGMGVGGWHQVVGESPRSNGLSSYSDVAFLGGLSSTSYACGVGSESEMGGVGAHLTSSWCCSCSWCYALTLALSSSSSSCWNSLSHLSCSSKSSLICS